MINHGQDSFARDSAAATPAAPSARSGGAAADAAARWLTEHGDVLWRFALSRTHSPDLAEEVVQETFIAAMQAYEGFGGRSSERTWLLGIAAHKASDALRRRARDARRVDPREVDMDAAAAAGSPDPTGEFNGEGRWARVPARVPRLTARSRIELGKALRRCLDTLPPGQSELVWLRDVLGVPNEEIRKISGLTPTNLWTRLHRARAALRSCMERSDGAGRDEEAKVPGR